MVAFAAIGLGTLLISRAAGPVMTIDPELAAVSGNASLASDSSSHNGFVNFGLGAGSGKFYIVGKDIVAPDGSIFFPVGTNTVSTSYWFWNYAPSYTWMNEYKAWGFNIVRLPEYFAGNQYPGDDSTKLSQLDTYVERFTAEKIVVLIDWHDIPFGTWPTQAQLDEAVSWWQTIANRYKHNPYVWFELLNEPGAPNDGALQDGRWISIHRQMINAIRSTGSENLIWVMGSDWGQDSITQIIPKQAQQLKTGTCNLGFTIHNYNQWADKNKLLAYVQDVQSKNLALMVTETGFHNDGAYAEGWSPATVESSVRNYYDNLPQRGIGVVDFTGMSDLNSKYSLVQKLPASSERARRYGHYYTLDNLQAPTNLTPVGTLLWQLAHNKPALGRFAGNLADSGCSM